MSWPGSLPAAIADGYQEVFADNTIRSAMETGYPKVRKRSTAAPSMLSLVFHMTAAQVTTLNTFFSTTQNDGVDSFTMTHPRTDVTETFRFLSAPEISISNGIDYRVSIKLEQLP